jgi:condensin complex subunit 3
MGLFDGAVAAAHLDAEGRKRKGGGGGSKQENHENDDDDDEKDPEADDDEKGGGGGDPTEAVERVLDLAAALACRPGSPAGSRAPAALLGRALALAGCPSERVRALCCSFAGMCASRLGGREEEEEEGGDDGDGPAAAAGGALDLAGQVLLPRLTDRSQSVRLAALGAAGQVLLARGCGGGAAEVAEAEVAEADALAAAVLLRMAHDPSPACRAAAVRSCPLTEATAPAILERVRDVRDLVRAEALGALAGGTGTAGAGTAGGATITITTTTTTSLPPLSPDQRVDILRSGLTGRCARTRAAAERLLCGTWMREARYDPARLLRTLDPVANEAVCEGVCRSIVRASEGGGRGAPPPFPPPWPASALPRSGRTGRG